MSLPDQWPDKTVWIFDFDGTLLDSMTAFRQIGGRVLARFYDLSETTGEELYRQTSGLPFVQQLATLFPEHPHNALAVDAFENEKRAYYHQAAPFPETRDALAALKRRGHFVAISSNNFQAMVEEMVDQLALPVDLVCGFQDGFGKGHAHFMRVQQASGAQPEQMLFVGDSLHDARLAKHCGIDFAGRAGTFANEEFVTHFPDLPVVASLLELL